MDEEQNRREGRGRLSSIDLLPEDAEADIAWANEQLRDRTMHSKAILDEFNARLADRGIGAVSKSAWSRYSVRKAIAFRKLDESNRLFAEVASLIGTDGADRATVGLAELIKTAIYEVIEGGKLNSKQLMELSRALSSTVSAEKLSTEHRAKLERENRETVTAAFDKAEEVVREAGLSGDRIAQLRREFLGVGK